MSLGFPRGLGWGGIGVLLKGIVLAGQVVGDVLSAFRGCRRWLQNVAEGLRPDFFLLQLPSAVNHMTMLVSSVCCKSQSVNRCQSWTDGLDGLCVLSRPVLPFD